MVCDLNGVTPSYGNNDKKTFVRKSDVGEKAAKEKQKTSQMLQDSLSKPRKLKQKSSSKEFAAISAMANAMGTATSWLKDNKEAKEDLGLVSEGKMTIEEFRKKYDLPTPNKKP